MKFHDLITLIYICHKWNFYHFEFLQTYFNHNSLTFLRSLINGGVTSELEHILEEGDGLKGGLSTLKKLKCRNRCRVAQVPLNEGHLAELGKLENYADLFVSALKKFGMLCLGLYR